MASPSVTYTFVNSTTADASQVNQNFADLIAGMTDGSKDFNIGALTCAGTATFNGNSVIGNAAGDTVTVNGTFTGTGGAVIPGTSPGIVPLTGVPLPNRFKASRITSEQTITKDGSRTVIFNNDSASGCEDPNSNYNTSTGIYTVPETGIYFVSYGLPVILGATAAAFINGGVNDGSSTHFAYSISQLTASKEIQVSGSGYMVLTAGASLTITIYAGSQDVQIDKSTANFAYFSAIKIGTV